MPAERSSTSTPRYGPSAGRRSSGPMSLSRILRGPGISPSNELSTTDPVLRDLSTKPSLSIDCTLSPCTPKGVSASEPSQGSNNELQTPRESPNPFLISPSTDSPTTPRAALLYQSFFGDEGPLTSPVLDSPTSRGARPLRRHGAVALLVPQTPSASNWPVDASAAADGDSTPSDLDAGSPDNDKTPRAHSRMLPAIEASEIVGDGALAHNRIVYL